MNALLELFLVVALFTLAGGFLGQYFTHSPLLAIPSGLACGALAYLTYRWREVVAAVQKSWRRNTSAEAIALLKDEIKIRARFAFGDTLMCSSPLIGLFVCFFAFGVLVSHYDGGVFFYILSAMTIAALSMILPFTLSFVFGSVHDRKTLPLDSRWVEADIFVDFAHESAPWLVFGVYPIRGIAWVGRKIVHTDYLNIAQEFSWSIARAMKLAIWYVRRIFRFTWNVVVMIHSKKRLIAGTTTLVFAVAAYFAENVSLAIAIALLAGGTSIILHELVAKKVLGVIPNGSRVAR